MSDHGSDPDPIVALLRLEGAALAAAATTLYVVGGHGWPLFAALLLVPDLSMAGYALGPRAGAALYNAAHSTLAPLALLVGGWAMGAGPAVAVALVWLAHVGADRALGYGLKRREGFRATHLGRVGRP